MVPENFTVPDTQLFFLKPVVGDVFAYVSFLLALELLRQFNKI